MESNPLHPFELHPYVTLSLFGLDISLNKAVIMMWVVIALAAGFLYMAGRQRRLVPTRLQSVAEVLVEFIRSMILDTMGEKGLRFLQILIPPGTPFWLLPLMVPIELVSQLARPLSLAVRLFANMTAGHTILAVLFGMVVSIPLISAPLAVKIGLLILMVVLVVGRRRVIAATGTWGLVGMCILIPVILTVIWSRWLPFAFSIAINGLEVVIAFIQAYIFTILTCVYLGDAITLHGHAEGAH